jgi:hypothetical protein
METKFLNCDLLPMEVDDYPWIFENNLDLNKGIDNDDIGKWMLFFDNDDINKKWLKAKKKYDKNKLNGVLSLKVSTAMKNPRSSNDTKKVIIFYCNNSNNQNHILSIGKTILKELKYTESEYIYYKTDKQTFEGVRATGKTKNYTYYLKTKNLVETENLFID